MSTDVLQCLGHFWGIWTFSEKLVVVSVVLLAAFEFFCIWVLFYSSVCWFLFFGFSLMRDSILLRFLLIFDLYLFSTIWLFVGCIKYIFVMSFIYFIELIIIIVDFVFPTLKNMNCGVLCYNNKSYMSNDKLLFVFFLPLTQI